MTIEEENIALREALNYANLAIQLISTFWVHEKHINQVVKILERIKTLTPPASK
jgi:hypothetical protein